MRSVVMGKFMAKSTIVSFVCESSVRVGANFNTFAQDVFDVEERNLLIVSVSNSCSCHRANCSQRV
jgi:hypothetical protein